MLLAWIVADNSVESVGKYLGVWYLPTNERVVHQNWKAFKTYSKWFAEYKKGMKEWNYANFVVGVQTEKKTKEVLAQWAMAGTPIEDVMKKLKLSNLSGSKLAQHQNYDALLTYIRYYKWLEPIRTANAHARAQALARANAV
ncbi:Avirulence (Avh) protein [Phytophthora megakarya]|uniref:Avirulence (Avh) protein n=1 Tax=Phytophthora megakarya TaxID=4795 RepID=A0A225X183_9STRA|nr:Avirulence (Avh) protein [Phytophthora megakarya]